MEFNGNMQGLGHGSSSASYWLNNSHPRDPHYRNSRLLTIKCAWRIYPKIGRPRSPTICLPF
uniref:Uncharacterized protein n=1 Tax=Cucumis melo TaxID=3656 RepID=A0A9I9E4E4_CUCME